MTGFSTYRYKIYEVISLTTGKLSECHLSGCQLGSRELALDFLEECGRPGVHYHIQETINIHGNSDE